MRVSVSTSLAPLGSQKVPTNTRGDVFTSRAPQPLDLIAKGSPLDWRAQAKRRDLEAMEYVQKHFRETGYLPKEYEMRRASDPAFNKAEGEAAMAQFQEAMERLRAWEAYWRDVYQYNNYLAWRETWTEEAVRNSLGGVMKPLMQQASKIGVREEIDAEIADLIGQIVDPTVGPVRTAESIRRFILMAYNIRGVLEPNMINKLSELVSAKALWFATEMPLRLFPGPSAINDRDSPDYVNSSRRIVGDNFRIGGVKSDATTVVLSPDRVRDAKRIDGVVNAVIKNIKGKFFTYQKKWLQLKGYRMVVTVDVSEAPWVLDPIYLQQVHADIRKWLPTEDTVVILEVFLIVNGIPRRVWPYP